MRRTVIVATVAMMLGCASAVPYCVLPPIDDPHFDEAVVAHVAQVESATLRPLVTTTGCYISCADGFAFRPQHRCKSDRRRFLDVSILRRETRRAIDGTVLSDTYVTTSGDYAVVDVERGQCHSVIASIIQQRAASERGQYPGEDEQGNPTPPQ